MRHRVRGALCGFVPRDGGRGEIRRRCVRVKNDERSVLRRGGDLTERVGAIRSSKVTTEARSRGFFRG